MDFPSFDDLFAVGRDEALVRNSKLSLDMIDREGTDSNVLVASAAAMADQVVAQQVELDAAVFLDSATGMALDRLVFDRYGLVRKKASVSVGSVTFSSIIQGAGGAPFTIPAGTQLQTQDGSQFLTTQPALFSASTSSVVVPIRSVLAGALQQAAAHTITSIGSSITGQPSDLTVDNPLATSGAADAESDSGLRQRARGFYQTLTKGTLAAIEQGALAVSGVVKARAMDVINIKAQPQRYVLLTIADQYTDTLANLNANPPTYQVQSQQLAARVFQGLDAVRAGGIYVDVKVAQVLLQKVLLSLTFTSGQNVDDVAVMARAMVVAATNRLRPGDNWDPAKIGKALAGIPGLLYTGTEIVSPPGPVEAKALQVFRTTLGLVTAGAASPLTPLPNSANPDDYSTP